MVRTEQKVLPKAILANCRSVVANVHEYMEFLNINAETVSNAGLTETWMHGSFQDSMCEHPSFYRIRQDRSNGKCGGGLIVLLNKK